MKVLGITFVVTGMVLWLVSLLVLKYSRSSEEKNIIRTTASSLLANDQKKPSHHRHHPTPLSSTHDLQHLPVFLR